MGVMGEHAAHVLRPNPGEFIAERKLVEPEEALSSV
jgi:hypothetical protein